MDFKRILALLLVIALSVFAIVALSACNPTDPGDGDDGDGEDTPSTPQYPEDDIPLTGLALIKKNVAQFKVVIASGAGSGGRRAAENLVKALKDLGVEIDDPIEDSNVAAVSDCEIIIGTAVRNRPDNCVVTADYLGKDGYVTKVVGQRVIIAGGTANLTRDTVESFIEDQLGITDSTTSLRNKSVSETLNIEVLTNYEIDSLKIGSTDISEFVIVCDQNDSLVYPSMTQTIQSNIQTLTGKRLQIIDLRDAGNKAHKIVVRQIPYSVDSAGKRTYDDGFYAYCNSGSLYIECEYSNAFLASFEKFFDEYVARKSGDVVISATLDYSEHVSTVTYCTYGGAVGDGKTNDFYAMLKTHQYANLGGQKVIADPGKVFYIGETGGTEIPIMTDCDFGTQVHAAGEKDVFNSANDPKLYMDEANFIIDDTIPEIYPYSNKYIFKIARDDPAFALSWSQLEEIGLVKYTYLDGETERTIFVNSDGSSVIEKGAASIPWIKNYTNGKKSMVSFHNTAHRDFIRFGANQNSGHVRRDFVIVDEEGNIDPSTPVVFEFKALTSVNIIPIEDTPITINGGHFENIANQALKTITHWLNGEEVTYDDYRNVFHEYGRGFKISRANVTMTNIRHKMQEGSEADPIDRATGKYATTGCGYPYYGFFLFDTANFVDVINCDLTGHIVYYEDKSQFKNDSGTASDAVAMGTYDFVVEYSNGISFDGLEMRGTDIGDSSYWGIMSSNGCKNLHFNNCVISRIDAHRGFWNVKIENTTIGQLFNVVGGGKLEVINTQRRVGNRFLRLRGDYGSSFEGEIILKNCLLDGYKAYAKVKGTERGDRESTGYIIFVDGVNDANSAKNSTGTKDPSVYYRWDFGYTCYLPKTVTIENFISRVTSQNTYVFNAVQDGHFNDPEDESPYQITEKVNLVVNNANLPTFLKSGDSISKTHDIKIAPTSSNYSTTEIRSVDVVKTTKNED